MTTSSTTRTPAPPRRPAPPARPRPRLRRLPGLHLLRRLRGRRDALPAWWPPALGVLLGLTGGTAYGLLATPQYTATSYVVVVPGAGTDAATALGFAQAYGRVATDSAVLTEARATARMPVDELRAAVRSATSPDAPMVEITGTAPSPGRAAAVSNAVANALTRTGNQATGSTGVQLSLFSPAFDPTEPTSPSVPLAVAVGGCAGGLAGGLAFLAAPRGRREPAFPGVPAPANRTEPAPAPGRTTSAAAKASAAPAPAGTAAGAGRATATAEKARDGRRRRGRRPVR